MAVSKLCLFVVAIPTSPDEVECYPGIEDLETRAWHKIAASINLELL